jgi:hypothetical protein
MLLHLGTIRSKICDLFMAASEYHVVVGSEQAALFLIWKDILLSVICTAFGHNIVALETVHLPAGRLAPSAKH